MLTFEQVLSESSWTEILDGKSYLAFDILEAGHIEMYFNESDSSPSASDKGNLIKSWPDSWDYQGSGFDRGSQRIWLRGDNTIRGVRA